MGIRSYVGRRLHAALGEAHAETFQLQDLDPLMVMVRLSQTDGSDT